jgi:hypothetical protein
LVTGGDVIPAWLDIKQSPANSSNMSQIKSTITHLSNSIPIAQGILIHVKRVLKI